MLHPSPLRDLHHKYAQTFATTQAGAAQRPGAAVGQKLAADIEYIPYGPINEQGQPTCELVATFGEPELEYAAIRRGAGVLDSPHRGTIIVTGDVTARRDFLNRMITQELQDLAPGVARQAFWLNRKGRIDADLLLVDLGGRIVIDVDIHQTESTVRTLNEFIFAEDIQITDASSEHHHISLHGRAAAPLIAAAAGLPGFDVQNLQGNQVRIGDADVIIIRCDQTGESGFELIMPRDQAANVWQRLLNAVPTSSAPAFIKPIGWYAFNIARIEAGTPLFNIDFGSTNLPHETGILKQRVSFTKGCYLGQEIVARMESLGRPKQQLVGLRMLSSELPIEGAQVFAMNEDESMGDQVGVVTSSTLSPMLSASPIAFAMVRTASAQMSTTLLVNAEGQQVKASVQELRFWKGD